MSAAEPVQTPKVKRSQFIDKLHDLLENPHDPDSLRWSPDGTAFEITTHEAKAKAALSPKWDFRSLSSFIRQLRRLSDRRRSSERRSSTTSYIVFHHPSGFFVRGDKSRLDGIIRKTRPKMPQSRRQSVASNLSTDDSLSSAPAAAAWSTGVGDAVQAGPSGLPSPSSPFSYTPVPGLAKSYQGPPATNDPAWRPYHAPGWPSAAAPSPFVQQQQMYSVAPVPGSLPPIGSDPTLPPLDQQHALRRSSLSEFKISPEPKVHDLQTNAHGQAHLPHVAQMPPHQPPPHASFAFPAQPFPPNPAYHPHAPPYDAYASHLPTDPHSPYPSGLPFSFDPTQPRGSGSSYGTGTSFSSRSSGQSLVPPQPVHPHAQRLSIAGGAVPSPPYSYSSADAEEDGSVPPQGQQGQGSYPPSRQGEYPQQVDYRRGSIHDPSSIDPHQPLDPHHQAHHQLPPLPLQTHQFNPSPAAIPPPPPPPQADAGGPQLLHPQPQHQALVDWRHDGGGAGGGGDPAGQFGGWAGFGATGGGGKEEVRQGEEVA
uniref:BY PROTMAP: gi/472583162/gb/EMS20816.1/ heat shock transcription factor [Rhodosporidium toruloides NP11] gi/647397385/emb/CDR40361.1/ RHTO0S05e02300g1_1 [Rhodosporidium toruloides] n=1 Tax=Rhodotorula toruloides TaxID=5286 RepID=A0A0K3CD41_RHOTO